MRTSLKRIPATEVKTHFGRIVQDVATSGTPVVIQTRGQDQAAIVSLHDLQRLSSSEVGPPMQERERVQAALRAAGLLREPAPEMRRRAEDYDSQHTPEGQEQVLSQLRGLHLEPSLSDIILQGRNWRPTSKRIRKQ